MRAYAWYVAYLALGILWVGAKTGMAGALLWPDHPEWNHAVPSFASRVSLALYMLFLRDLVGLRDRFPRLRRVLDFGSWVALCGLFALCSVALPDFHAEILETIHSGNHGGPYAAFGLGDAGLAGPVGCFGSAGAHRLPAVGGGCAVWADPRLFQAHRCSGSGHDRRVHRSDPGTHRDYPGACLGCEAASGCARRSGPGFRSPSGRPIPAIPGPDRIRSPRRSVPAHLGDPLVASSPNGVAGGVGEEVEAQLQDLADSVREISHQLHPSAHGTPSLQLALSELARAMENPQLAFQLDLAYAKEHLPTVNLELFRIVQESISNAVHHGKTTRIRIATSAQGKGMLLSIQDNGTGLGAKSGGIGLAGIEARARRMGGTFRIAPLDEHGTVVEVWIPVEG
ncbi:MAG: hypothetical protein IPN71_07370 [Fibrobacteres bacterium]|nr:hypothetical protein [Fibrobacterota bacterium]